MRITVNRNELGTAFAWAVKGIATRPVVPILEGVLVSVEGDQLTLSAFDYERGSRAWLPGTDAEPGVILVSGPSLKKVIAALPKGVRVTAKLTADDDALTIESGDITWKLAALPRAEYPALPVLPELAGVIDGATFARSVARVYAAASHDDTLPILTGICFTPTDDALTIAATDRYRLAVDPIAWTSTGAVLARADGTTAETDKDAGQVIVPAKAVAEFAAKADKSGKVSVYLSHDFVAFRDDSRELIIRTISGSYVRYESRVNFASEIHASVDAPKLADVIKRITPSIERNCPILLKVSADSITVSSWAGGDVHVESKPIAAEADGEITLGFSPEYLVSLLAGFDGTVHLGLAERKPALLTEDASGYRAIVVPQRIAD
jgi:DNA polymerase-3 subunit beta